MKFLDIALRNAARGFKVHPLKDGEKAPRLTGWPEKATNDHATIEDWAKQWPTANCGVVTDSTLCVLESDGLPVLEKLLGDRVPRTFTVQAREGRPHFYFLQTDKTRAFGNRDLAGIFEFKQNRRYVVSEGSIHPSGASYEVIDSSPLVPCPDWIVEKLEAAKTLVKSSQNVTDVKLQRLLGFLDHYSIPIRTDPRRVKGGWTISIVCPWVEEHSGESNRETEVSYIPVLGLGFKCFHAHCADRHWKEVRLEMEKRNPALPPYFGAAKLPKLVHSEIARAFITDNDDFVCVYDHDAATGVWKDTRWIIGDRGDLLLRRALRDYLDQLYPLYPEPEDKKKVDPRRTLLQSPFLSSVLAEVKPLLPPVSILDFDRDPWLLACPDGMVIDLSIGQLRRMRREDKITRRIDVTPVSGPTPDFDKFIADITQGNTELADYLLHLCCLLLSGHAEQLLIFFWGSGRNGKGVLIRLMAKLLGVFAASLRPDELSYSKDGGDRMKRTLAKFAGKRFAYPLEAVGKRMNVAVLKMLSGGDKISFARMRQDDEEVDPTHKIVLTTNDRPDLPADPAIRARLHLVPFLADFSGDKGDRFIEDKLWAEREGILAKLLTFCVDVKRDGLRAPAVVRAATDELMDELDTAGQFIAERVTVGSADDFTPQAEVDDAVRAWLPGIMVGNDWRLERIKTALKTDQRFKYGRKRIGAGAAKAQPWGFYFMRLEAPGS